MRKIIAALCTLWILLGLSVSPACAGTQARLTKRISTRSGPGTAYTEPGTFFQKTWQQETVTVLSKASADGIWWLQIEFLDGGKLRRAYTGSQRVDCDIAAIPSEQTYGTAQVTAAGSIAGYFGPGTHYALDPDALPARVKGTVLDAENGYLLLDFADQALGRQRRTWVAAEACSVNWTQNAPAGAGGDQRTEGPSGQPYGRAVLRLAGDAEGYTGPGTSYPRTAAAIPYGTQGVVLDAQNEYLLLSFYDAVLHQQRNVWGWAGHFEIDWFAAPLPGAVVSPRAQIPAGTVFWQEDNPRAWCCVTALAEKGGYSLLDLHTGEKDYNQLLVFMEGRDYGFFATSDGHFSYVAFFTDQIVFEDSFWSESSTARFVR